jgi:hypothetical protein
MEERKKLRVYADGCFDLFHLGINSRYTSISIYQDVDIFSDDLLGMIR